MQRVMQRSSMMALALFLASRAMAAPDAAAIMKKATASMKGLKTYQATWVMTMGMGAMGTMSINMDMKMIPGQGKFAMKMSPTGQATGQMAMAGAMANMQSVDDGKNMYMYLPVMGGYQKGPHNPALNMDPRKQMMEQTENANFKYLRMEKMAGRDTHVIEALIDMRKAMEAQAKRSGRTLQVPPGAQNMPPMKAEMYVDAATGRMKQMVMHMNMGGMMGGAGASRPGAPKPPAMTMDMKMAVTREVLNAPIPDAAFKFTPPPGAKLLQGTPGGMGMGMPGMGGGMGRPRPPAGDRRP